MARLRPPRVLRWTAVLVLLGVAVVGIAAGGRLPAYATGVATVLADGEGAVRTVALVRADRLGDLRRGQRALLRADGDREGAEWRVAEVRCEPLSPEQVRRRLDVAPAVAARVTRPVALAVLRPAEGADATPLDAGRLYDAAVELGEGRILRLPLGDPEARRRLVQFPAGAAEPACPEAEG